MGVLLIGRQIGSRAAVWTIDHVGEEIWRLVMWCIVMRLRGFGKFLPVVELEKYTVRVPSNV